MIMFNASWRCGVLLTWTLLCTAAQSVGAVGTSEVIGTWEGQSLCTVPNSSCHDEHVVYHIKSADGGNLVIAGYKIVKGEEEFMGDLECQYSAAAKKLSCSAHTRREDDWEFQVSGKHMSGTLVMGKEKTLFRKISVEKSSD